MTDQPASDTGTHRSRIYLADAGVEERSALYWLSIDLGLDVAGESADWVTTLAEAARIQPDVLLVDSGLIPGPAETSLAGLRSACPNAMLVLMINPLKKRQTAPLTRSADLFISKDDPPEQVTAILRRAASKP